jgi:hypothetical protein
MKGANQVLSLTVAILGGALGSGCSSGAHATATRSTGGSTTPVYLAQSAAACTQMDSTMTCCIKKYPTNAAEACGAAAWEIAEVLAVLKGVDVPEREEDDGEEREDWREYCRDEYVRCIDLKWEGNCSDCLRRCEGQRGRWPKNMCFAPKTKRRR